MYATSSYLGEQLARSYTRERIRDAEARRTVRAVRIAARESRYVEPAMPATPRPRRWRRLVIRTTAA